MILRHKLDDKFYVVSTYFMPDGALWAEDKNDLFTYKSPNGHPIPTQEEIDAKVKELIAEWEAEEWKRKRVLSYPEIGDQLDALYHAGLFPKEMAAKLKAVKEKNPKPELPNGN